MDKPVCEQVAITLPAVAVSFELLNCLRAIHAAIDAAQAAGYSKVCERLDEWAETLPKMQQHILKKDADGEDRKPCQK